MDKEILDLIEKVREGDEIAFATLSDTYANLIDGAVKRFAPSFGIDAESDGDIYGSDDLRQIAVVALYKAALTYDPENEGKNVSFGLFAKICVRNAMISALRKYKTEVKRIESAKESVKNTRISNASHNADPLYKLLHDEDLSEIKYVIYDNLSEFERKIFDNYIVGKSVGEIAYLLGKNEKSVSNALYRVKVKIRGLLKNK